MPILVARASEGLRPHPQFRFPGQSPARHSLAALLSIARRHTAAANTTRSIRYQPIQSPLAVSQVWWADGGHRENDRWPNPTPFSAGPGPSCRMKPLSTIRKLCVLRRAPSLCVWPPKQSFLLASPDSPFATIVRCDRLSAARCCLMRFDAQLRRTSTPYLPSIEFA